MAANASEQALFQGESSSAFGGARAVLRRQILLCGLIGAIALAYLSSLSPGHVFVNDDFAGYVMHAANLAEGRHYGAIHYISNPQAPWLAPLTGYPPVFPMMLAPVYKWMGLNLRALKAVTAVCFVVFLSVLAVYLSHEMSAGVVACVLLLIACNPVFWEYRQYVLSEFPYLMCSFGALLVMQKAYANLQRTDLKLKSAVLLSLLLNSAYGVRTIGIALLAALILADIAKFRRPSRFIVVTAALTLALILAQSILITSPSGYLSAYHFSPRMIVTNAVYYGKTLSYVWQNGFSKKVQIVFALLFTGLAAIRFMSKLRAEKSAREFYLLAYLAILIAWSAEIGLRGLLPVLPLYFAYGVQQVDRFYVLAANTVRPAILVCVMVFAAVSYSGEFKRESRLPPEPNVLDPEAQEMFSFLRNGTKGSEVAIFAKPRTLALFTGHDTASLAFDESVKSSADFMRTVNATIFVQSVWSPPAWQHFLQNNWDSTQIFENSEYRVFRINWQGNASQAAR